MGKLALMLVLALASAAIVHGSASGDGIRETARQASERQRLAVARTAAKTGWARAKQNLVADFVSGTVSGTDGEATYTTTVTVTGGQALVTSVGSVPVPGRSTTTDYQIVYRLEAAGGDGTPPFAAHAIAVDGNLSMYGNGSIVMPGVTGTPGDSLDILVHANGNIHAGSASTVVEGFGTYTGSRSGMTANTFQPRSNPDGAPVLTRSDSVAIPAVNPTEILAAYGGAPTVYPTNPLDYWTTRLSNRTLPGGPRDEPVVYYSPGRLLMSNVTFDGYAVVITEGEIDVSGTVRGTADSGTNESALALFTPSTLSMNGGANAYASVFAGGGLSYNGNVDVYGNLVVGGDFAHGGGATVHYLPTAPSLYRTWGWVDPTLRLLAYREQ